MVEKTPRELYTGLRSGLITSGIDLDRLEKASKSKADYIHLELEDGILPERRPEARATVAKALKTFDWSGKITMPRVNSVDSGYLEDDVAVVADGVPTAFLLAKCQGPEDVEYLDRLITRREGALDLPDNTIKIAVMIERARAFQYIDQIATASRRMFALHIGPTDLSAELGYRRTYRGEEIETYYVRSRLVVAAHTHGLLAFDTPCVHFREPEETYRQARWSYHVGFDAKSAIYPPQVEHVNRAFSPTEEEVVWAESVFAGKEEANNSAGRAVWEKDGMMLDDAMIARATAILELARKGV
ncbi:MAG TPA: CoA ester lyase [Jatrophihabitantaceae bacterium]|nr:CoA ester lyase [Jatrophihabitantaceae bacterium]